MELEDLELEELELPDPLQRPRSGASSPGLLCGIAP
jgi:hypothetical protein